MSEGPGVPSPAGGPRLLVAITYGFSVRYLLPTGVLDGLRSVCRPVIGLGWDDPSLERELAQRGFEVVRLPDARMDHGYRMYRRRMAIVHQRRLATPTAEVERAVRQAHTTPRNRLIAEAKRLRDMAVILRPGGMAAVEAAEADVLRRGTNVEEFGEFLRRHSIDAVVSITPYHDQDGLLLWAGAGGGVPTLTSVISFDNPTTRARMITRSDRILVWNRFNRDEILRSYLDVTRGQVAIIGAPQFDLHHHPDLRLGDGQWRASLGLPPEGPVILYGAGPSFLVPDEPRLALLIDDAIDHGRIAGRPHLLIRRHPADVPEVWSGLQPTLRHSTLVDPWASTSNPHRSWPTNEDLAVQMSSLAHSSVHVNVCSSMTVDGAVFDRPQIGPSFIPGADAATTSRVADLYRREHWLPIARSGGLVMAPDAASLISAINDGLAHPEAGRDGRHRMLVDILTFLDGRSSDRLVEQVGQFLVDHPRAVSRS
jgi:hypothetical protein